MLGMFSLLKQLLPTELFTPCPYKGLLQVVNASADNDMLRYAPKGIIKFVMKFQNDDDKNVFTIVILCTNK
jgi:hypothetical protein